MPTLPAEALKQMVRIIVREADPETVILFGSHARGDARPDSDVDLMVIEQAPFSAQRSHVQQAFEKSLKAWLCAIGMTYPFTHHINRLLMLLKVAGT